MKAAEFVNYLQKSQYPFEAKFQFINIGIHCFSNSEQLMFILSEYYAEWKVDEFTKTDKVIPVYALEDQILAIEDTFENFVEAGKTRLKEQFINLPEGKLVKKVKTGVQVVSLSDKAFAHGPLVQYSNQLINYINALFIEQQLDQNSMLFHAAAVQWNGKGYVIAAPSGKGKSTSALRLMNSGAKFISNDRVIIRKGQSGYQIIGVPKHPRINPGTILSNPQLSGLISDKSAYTQLSREELWNLEEKYDAIIPDLYGENRFVLSAEFSDFIILDWDTAIEGSAQIQEIKQDDFKDRSDLLSAIMKVPTPMSPVAFESLKGISEEHYIDFMQEMHVKVVTGGVQDLSEFLT